MMVTLALTVVVPVTVDPEAGEVMFTTKPPGSCAAPVSGETQTALRISKRAAA